MSHIKYLMQKEGEHVDSYMKPSEHTPGLEPTSLKKVYNANSGDIFTYYISNPKQLPEPDLKLL